MKKFTVEEAGMLLAALNHMYAEFESDAEECRNVNAFLSAQYHAERSNAYLNLYHKVSDMLDDITE